MAMKFAEHFTGVRRRLALNCEDGKSYSVYIADVATNESDSSTQPAGHYATNVRFRGSIEKIHR